MYVYLLLIYILIWHVKSNVLHIRSHMFPIVFLIMFWNGLYELSYFNYCLTIFSIRISEEFQEWMLQVLRINDLKWRTLADEW